MDAQKWVRIVVFFARIDAIRRGRKQEAYVLALCLLPIVVGQLEASADYGATYSLKQSDQPTVDAWSIKRLDRLYTNWSESMEVDLPGGRHPAKLSPKSVTSRESSSGHWMDFMPAFAGVFDYDAVGMEGTWLDALHSFHFESPSSKGWLRGGMGVTGEVLEGDAYTVAEFEIIPEEDPPVDGNFVWMPTYVDGEVDTSVLPLNTMTVVNGLTSRSMEQVHIDAGFDWPHKVFSSGRPGASWMAALNSWNSGAFDPITGVYWFSHIGGHGDSSYNGVSGYNTRTMKEVIARIPSDPDDPKFPWRSEYKKLKTGSYSRYPLDDWTTKNKHTTGVLPDGTPTSTHIYNNVSLIPERRELYTFRGAMWRYCLPDHPFTPDTWAKIQIKMGDSNLGPSTNNNVFWDEINKRFVGSFNPLYKTDYWGFVDPDTGVFTKIGLPRGLRMNATNHACRVGDNIVLKAWVDKKVEKYAVFSLTEGRWITQALPVDGEIDYAAGISVSWQQMSSNEMMPFAYVKEYGKCLLMDVAGSDRGQWWQFDPVSGVQEKIFISGRRVPALENDGSKLHIGGKMFFDASRSLLFIIAPVSPNAPLMYVMRTGRSISPVKSVPDTGDLDLVPGSGQRQLTPGMIAVESAHQQ